VEVPAPEISEEGGDTFIMVLQHAALCVCGNVNAAKQERDEVARRVTEGARVRRAVPYQQRTHEAE
jgi:hypothetical protein